MSEHPYTYEVRDDIGKTVANKLLSFGHAQLRANELTQKTKNRHDVFKVQLVWEGQTDAELAEEAAYFQAIRAKETP
jgi:hypothetical protein